MLVARRGARGAWGSCSWRGGERAARGDHARGAEGSARRRSEGETRPRAGRSVPRHEGRPPCPGPSSDPRRDRLHFFPCREAAGRLLRVDEIAVERDLEHTARALDQLDLGTVDPGEPVAHTERFGFIPSSTAIFDSELHRRSPAEATDVRAQAYIPDALQATLPSVRPSFGPPAGACPGGRKPGAPMHRNIPSAGHSAGSARAPPHPGSRSASRGRTTACASWLCEPG